MISRRDFLWHSGGGLGGIALAALLGKDGLLAADGRRPDGGLHLAPKAKRVVQLFMAGAASHLDLFDFKPELVKRHGQPSDFGEHVEAFQNGLGPWLKPLWDFEPHGKCGKLLSEGHVRGTLDPRKLSFTGTVRSENLVVGSRSFGDMHGVGITSNAMGYQSGFARATKSS